MIYEEMSIIQSLTEHERIFYACQGLLYSARAEEKVQSSRLSTFLESHTTIPFVAVSQYNITS